MRALVEARLAPYAAALGRDRQAYTHHVLRVLALCEELSAGAARDERFVTAAVFHDLGIWTAGTFDYLAPSADLARGWLLEQDRPDLVPEVVRMIDLHHKVRPAGEDSDPVEVFRRADTIDVTRGLRRFGVARAAYRWIAGEHPNAGFHRRLAQLTLRRLREDPLHPAPMLKW